MKHLKQMTFTLFKELFNLQGNHYRVINEDIAALRNIAWAADKRAIQNKNYNSFAGHLLLLLNEYTPQSIGDWRDAIGLLEIS